ncbi:MAG: shikimate dehydrogenase [Planctomycetes bacterium]|nr:shikimate dehydrogenase [Planctomycetota bacterium]
MSNQPQQDVCCLIGEPVAGNPTQYMLEKAFEAARLDWRFLTFEVSPLELEGALRGVRIFGFHGLMLAPPHRSRVQPYLEELGDAARISGQVNCIQQKEGRLHGYNTEGRALRQLLEQAGSLKDARVTILGAGRLARAIGAELAIVGVGELIFGCREPDSAEKLVQTLKDQTPLEHCHAVRVDSENPLAINNECQALINATPVGRNGPDERLALSLENLSKAAVVADVVYNPPQTWLICEAADRECATIDGLTLLIEQAALAFEIWTGVSANRQAMREAVEEFLVL